MANEIKVIGPQPSSTVYAIATLDRSQLVADQVNEAAVPMVTADWGNYVIPLVETPEGSNYYYADLPAWMLGSRWDVSAYLQSGSEPHPSVDTFLGGQLISESGLLAAQIAAGVLATYDQYTTIVTTTSSRERVELLLAAATSAINRYCNLIYTAEDRTEFQSGTGFNFVTIGARPLSITSVTINPESADPVVYDGSEFGFTDYGTIYWKLGGTFPVGFRNVKVIYRTYGVVPYDLMMACILVAQALEGRTDSEALVSEKTVDKVKIKWADLGDFSDPTFGPARNLLAPFRRAVLI